MQNGYNLYPSKYNFKYLTRLQSACSYQGKLQIKYAVLTFCDFKPGVTKLQRHLKNVSVNFIVITTPKNCRISCPIKTKFQTYLSLKLYMK